MAGRVGVTRSVNRVLIPRFLAMGFVVRGNEGGKGWKEGCILKRVWEGRQQAMFIGSQLGGRALGINVGRETPDGFEYMAWEERGLSREHLSFSTQEEFDQVLERLLRFIDSEIEPWLEYRK